MSFNEKKITEEVRPCKKGGLHSAKVRDTIFFWCLVTIPLLVLAANMIFINLNSILLAFKGYTGTGESYYVGFDNFKEVFWAYQNDIKMVKSLENSLIVYGVSVVVTAIVPILFSYYLFKKMWGTGIFKVILFLPNIISPIVTVIIFKFLVDRVIPGLMHLPNGLLSDKATTFGTILFYSMWMTFGSGMLIQLGAMNATDQSTIDAGQIDGVGFFGELWHIVLPKSYGVISIGFITGIASIFTNQFGLYAFYGEHAPARVSTLGYYFYVETSRAAESGYPYWAAWGLVASMITIPLTFIARYLINRFGPSEE